MKKEDMHEVIPEGEEFSIEKHLATLKHSWWEKPLLPFQWAWYRLGHKWTEFRYRCQRFKRGYTDIDVWEVRDWFIRTAKPLLREMRAKAFSYPEEVGEEQWHKILEEMADLLEVMDIWDDTAARKQAGIAVDDKTTEALWAISAEKEKAKDRFFLLFNRHFYDLWY